MSGPILRIFLIIHTPMASAGAGAGAYNGGQGAEPPAGVQGAEPPVEVRGAKPPEVDEVFVFKTVIFNASATVFARNCVLFELLLLCSGLWIHSQNLLSIAIAGQHLSIIRQVHKLCLGLTDRLRKNRTSPSFSYPTPSPSPSLPPVPSSPSPPLPWPYK